MSDHLPATPVSLKVDVSRLPAKGVTVKLSADTAQRDALAREHGLESVEAFDFELRVAPWKRDGVQMAGQVTAKITQACVATLEPVQNTIDEAVSALFVPENSRIAAVPVENGEMLLNAEGEDAPEIFTGNRIDAGAVAEEFFALAIDPFPRVPGAELPATASVEDQNGKTRRPFEKLGELMRKR